MRFDRFVAGVKDLTVAAYLVCTAGICSAGTSSLTATSTIPTLSCGPIRDANFQGGGAMDYRLRFSDSRVRDGIALVDRNHTDLARDEARSNPTNVSNLANLDFTLRYSPNHLDALRQLIAYTKAGGKFLKFDPLDCYLEWARQFAPDDVSVLQIEAVYLWKAGDLDQAEQLFLQALRAEPNSVELHYNAGLYYLARKQYGKAQEHARFAYDNDYPLPGLRNGLKRAGQWTLTPESKNREITK